MDRTDMSYCHSLVVILISLQFSLQPYCVFAVTWSRSGPGLECALNEAFTQVSVPSDSPEKTLLSCFTASNTQTSSRGNTSVRPLFENGYCICRSFLSREQRLNSDIFLCSVYRWHYGKFNYANSPPVLNSLLWSKGERKSFTSSRRWLKFESRPADASLALSCLCFANKPRYDSHFKAGY